MESRTNRIYEFGEFRLDADEHLLHRGSEQVALSPRTFDLLVKLVENAGHLMDKDTLIREVWSDSVVEDGNLNRTISNLRKALGEKPNEVRFIQTVPRVGYRFVGEVSEVKPQRGQTSTHEKPKWLFPASIAALLLVIFGAAMVWQSRHNNSVLKAAEVSDAPLRLTEDPADDSHPRWTRDGRIRFFRTDANHRSASLIMDADGTNQTAVQDFATLKSGVWSPDGTKVVFRKPDDNTASYLANADGSNEIPLPFIKGNFDWSFDSKEIVYQKTVEPNNPDIFIYTLDTGRSRNLTNNPAFDADPSFSPDGKQVAFVSSRDGNSELYLIQTDGSSVQRLTTDPSDDSHPVFSPDGTAIAFTSDRKNESADAYLLVDPNGSRTVLPLTDWPSSETVEPGCWSADGTRIAFFSDRNGKDDIYVMSAESFRVQAVLTDSQKDLGFPSYSPDGTKIVYQMTAPDKSGGLAILDVNTKQSKSISQSAIADAAPAWSPDGQWIAFQNRVDSNTEISVVKPDGTGLKNLTNDPSRDVSPAWSPDGKQIVFTSNRGATTQVLQLFLMNSDGSNPHRIYTSSGTSGAPSWSPDGKQIVFANDKEDYRSGNFEIFTIEPENSEAEKRLTFRKRYDVSPVFSPNGKKIVFVSELDGNSEVYLMNSDGTNLVRLTRNAAEDISPRWSPDGSRIIFSSNRHGKFGLYEIQVRGD